jgi:hypothetical protein
MPNDTNIFQLFSLLHFQHSCVLNYWIYQLINLRYIYQISKKWVKKSPSLIWLLFFPCSSFLLRKFHQHPVASYAIRDCPQIPLELCILMCSYSAHLYIICDCPQIPLELHILMCSYSAHLYIVSPLFEHLPTKNTKILKY